MSQFAFWGLIVCQWHSDLFLMHCSFAKSDIIWLCNSFKTSTPLWDPHFPLSTMSWCIEIYLCMKMYCIRVLCEQAVAYILILITQPTCSPGTPPTGTSLPGVLTWPPARPLCSLGHGEAKESEKITNTFRHWHKLKEIWMSKWDAQVVSPTWAVRNFADRWTRWSLFWYSIPE